MHRSSPAAVAFAILAGCASAPAAAPSVTAPASEPTPVLPAIADERPSEPETPARPPARAALEPFAIDPVPSAIASRIKSFLRRTRGVEAVAVLSGVPGDDAGVLATVRMRPVRVRSEEEEEGTAPASPCERTRLVRVVGDAAFAPASLRIEGEIEGACPTETFEGSGQGDLDLDGKLELFLVWNTEVYTSSESRSGPGAVAGRSRVAAITGPELASPAIVELEATFEDTEGGEPEASMRSRIEFVDDDGDGHPDLVRETRFVDAFCTVTDVWNSPGIEECHPEDRRFVALYVPSSDAWDELR